MSSTSDQYSDDPVVSMSDTAEWARENGVDPRDVERLNTDILGLGAP